MRCIPATHWLALLYGGELGTRTPDFLRVMHLLNQGENFIIP